LLSKLVIQYLLKVCSTQSMQLFNLFMPNRLPRRVNLCTSKWVTKNWVFLQHSNCSCKLSFPILTILQKFRPNAHLLTSL
jgi:hypothetical protein